MVTQVGPVQIDVPRDRDVTFEPKIVAKRRRRLSGVEELVISLQSELGGPPADGPSGPSLGKPAAIGARGAIGCRAYR